MTKPVFLVIAALLMNMTFCWPASAQQTSQNDLKRAQDIRRVILKTGTSLNKEIKVKLKDNREVRGFISEITDDHFVVNDASSGVPSSFTYDQVAKVKVRSVGSERRDFTTGASVYKKVIGGFAIGVGVLVIACFASKKCTGN
jgi:hypothetical protein